MLYHVTFHTDHQALGFDDQRERVMTAELHRAVETRRAGRLLGFWSRADLGGVIFVVDAESHTAFMEEIRSLPIFPFLRTIDVVPVVAHAAFPEFGTEGQPDERS